LRIEIVMAPQGFNGDGVGLERFAPALKGGFDDEIQKATQAQRSAEDRALRDAMKLAGELRRLPASPTHEARWSRSFRASAPASGCTAREGKHRPPESSLLLQHCDMQPIVAVNVYKYTRNRGIERCG
jgi:hypothetical protein